MKQKTNRIFIGLFLFSLFTLCGSNQSTKRITSAIFDRQQAGLSSKTLYIDFSLVKNYQDDQTYSPSFSYFEEEERMIGLNKIEDGIFYTNEAVPIEFLMKAEWGFRISLNEELSTSWLIDEEFLADMRYDYIYLVDSDLENGLSVGGYGRYGEVLENPGATYETQRVWLCEEEVGEADYDFGYRRVVSYVYEGKRQLVSMVKLVNPNDGLIYYYVDIPYTLSAVEFYSMGSLPSHNYSIYSSNIVPVLEYGICYELNNLGREKTLRKKLVYGADSNMLARVVEAYLTFGKDTSNGSVSSTISNLFQTWMKNKKSTKSELKIEKILDYEGYVANGNSYVGLKKIATYSVFDKWNGLCNNAGIDADTGKESLSFYTFLGGTFAATVIVSLSTALAFILLLVSYLIRKKSRK